jgi:hypothetical protein
MNSRILILPSTVGWGCRGLTLKELDLTPARIGILSNQLMEIHMARPDLQMMDVPHPWQI